MVRLRRFSAWCLDRGITLAACLIAAGAAFYASYSALCVLGQMAGWAPHVRPALPLTIDVIAVAAGVRYARLAPTAEEARAVAYRGVKWTVVVSIVGNAIAHVSMSSGTGFWSGRALPVAVSMVPAVGLGYVIHLLSTHGQTVTEARAEAAAAEAAAVAELAEDDGPEPEPTHRADAEEEQDAEDDDGQDDGEPIQLFPRQDIARRRHARQGSVKARGLELMEQHGGKLTPAQLADKLGCTTRHAQNIVNAYGQTA